MGGKIEKSNGGTPLGPRRGSAPASVRRVKISAKKPEISGKFTLSAKNNVAMHMIAPFMPKHNGKHFIL